MCVCACVVDGGGGQIEIVSSPPCPLLLAGKSAVINALLGQRYLAEGILPTTNEINVLKWADPERGGERTEQVGSQPVAEQVLYVVQPGTGACTLRGPPPTATPSSLQSADGLYTRYLGAELLRELNVVDTPGTNVILERQQRLTEEYVPRADLVSIRTSS